MLAHLRETSTTILAAHSVCILSGATAAGAWSQPMRYRSHGLTLHCEVARWADAAFYLEQPSRVVAIILIVGDAERWLQCVGIARVRASDQPILVAELVAERLELFDGARGWGVRETFDV